MLTIKICDFKKYFEQVFVDILFWIRIFEDPDLGDPTGLDPKRCLISKNNFFTSINKDDFLLIML